MADKRKKQALLNFKKLEKPSLPACKYGLSCYQTNPEHKLKFGHPSPQPTKILIQDKNLKVISPKTKVTEDSKGKCTPQAVKVQEATVSEKSPKRKTATKKTQSLTDVKQIIKDKFLFDMPDDFYELWYYCKSVNKKQPSEAFADLNLHLVGPYDVLNGGIENSDISSDEILCHWRYYYDPPEFQTVIKRDGDEGYHIGYFRDVPTEMPFVLAANEASIGPTLTLVGDNIFAAIISEINNGIKKSTSKVTKERFKKIVEDLTSLAKKKNYDLTLNTEKTRARSKKVVSKTFHNFGITVPVDKHEVGYRSICVTNAKLKSILRKICTCETDARRLEARTELDHLITNAQIANDECDFGQGLELAIDLFCFGDEYLHEDIKSLLPLAYELLNRPEFGRIIRAHLLNRRKGDELSIIDV